MNRPPRYSPPSSGTLRRRLSRDESGLTLIEVVVSALLVVLIGGSFVALGAVQQTTGDQQRRTQATELAQRDQERMRGMSADQLMALDQTREIVVDGVTFDVTSAGRFINRGAGTDSCSAAGPTSADYIRTTTSVDWGSNDRPPVVVNGLATPPAGGGAITRVVDQNNAAISGVKVLASGSSSATLGTKRTGVSDTNGCTIFPAMPVGDYDLSASLSGYVNPDGGTPSSQGITATTTGTAATTFRLGRAGGVNATFTTRTSSGLISGQRAPSLTWSNAGMAIARSVTPSSPATSISTGSTLFPFYSSAPGTYTGNYTIWSGSCLSAQPPTANRTLATVGPGQTASAAIQMPMMRLYVNYRSGSSGSGTRVLPRAIKLTDSCGQSWYPSIASDGATSSDGAIDLPGQPYGTYTICASYRTGNTTYRTTLNSFANTNYNAPSATTIIIPRTTTGEC